MKRPAALLLPLADVLVRFTLPDTLPVPAHDPPDATDLALRAFARERALLDALATGSLVAVPGAGEALGRLAGVAPLLLVADESRRVVDRLLEATGWRDLVRRAITLDDVDAGRPASSLHRAALARLGIAPAAAVAVEASADGIRAARAAGVTRLVACGPAASWNAGLPRVATIAELSAAVLRAMA